MIRLDVSTVTLILFLTLGCGKESSDDGDSKKGDSSSGAIGEITDSTEAGMIAFSKGGTYKEWVNKDGAPKTTSAPHRSFVQNYFNKVAYDALVAGTKPLPVGSVIVKEMFSEIDGPVVGHAIMAKATEGVGIDTWVWFEGFVSDDYGNPYYGMDLDTCTGCHSSGTDYVRTAVSE
jgi:hypothetical protein